MVDNPSNFPRTYKASVNWRLKVGLAALLFMAFPIGLISTQADPMGSWIWLGGASVLFLGLGTTLLFWVFRSRLTLHPDALEIRGFRHLHLPYDEIKGSRRADANGIPLLLLACGGDQVVQFAMIYKRDEVFDAWLERVPDLDARDSLAAEKESITKLEAQGVDGDRQVREAERWTRRLYYLSWGAFAWVLFKPVPYQAAIGVTIVLPLVALAFLARYPGVVSTQGRKNDPHPDVSVAMHVPGFFLCLRWALDWEQLEWLGTLLAAVAIGCLWAIVVPHFERGKKRWWQFATTAALMSVYGGGVVGLANGMLDRSAPTHFTAEVLDKNVSRGRFGDDYRLELEAWGPRKKDDTLGVPRELYESVEVGQTIELLLYPGALGQQWVVPRKL